MTRYPLPTESHTVHGNLPTGRQRPDGTPDPTLLKPAIRNPGMRTAFKEWAVIVDALGRGEQILLLRKGGISEGRGGFRVEHPEFLLFPTLFHQQRDSVLPAGQQRFDELMRNAPPADRIRIEFVASAAGWWRLGSLEDVHGLRGLHLWKDEVIEQRFNSGNEQAIYALALRVSRLPEPVELPLSQEYGGCRSWVELARDVGAADATPVLSDSAFARKMGQLICSLRFLRDEAGSPD